MKNCNHEDVTRALRPRLLRPADASTAVWRWGRCALTTVATVVATCVAGAPAAGQPPAQAGACTVTGFVTTSNTPLPGAVITVGAPTGPLQASSTGIDGTFTLSLSGPGRPSGRVSR